MAYTYGYDLPLLVGHLEDLVWTEESDDLEKTFRGERAVRLKKCQDALQLLTEVIEREPEDDE